jgi:uncharacterized protein YkwD
MDRQMTTEDRQSAEGRTSRTLRRRLRHLVTVPALLVGGMLTWAAPTSAATPTPPFIAAEAHWLTTVNYYRAMAGLGPVVENTAWSAGAYNHSCYMLWNGMTHDEDPSKFGYTPSGDEAGNAGNVTVTTEENKADRRHIELWMTGPFHAIGILRHNLTTVGYGDCNRTDTPKWRSAATLNVISGLDYWKPRPTTPIVWPGNGTTTNLSTFVTETPNPVTMCGWPAGQAGLPVIAMLPETPANAVGTITGPSGPLQTCTLSAANIPNDPNSYNDDTARSILAGDNAVVVMARNPLTAGTYQVNLTTSSRVVSWSFTVDPAAALGPQAPTTSVVGPESGITLTTPVRIADSRTGTRVTRLAANTPVRLTLAGQAGVPSDATALALNVTTVGTAANGFLTLYPCTPTVPSVSTVNMRSGRAVANSTIAQLDAQGGLCAFASQATDLILDVTAVLRPAATGGMVTVSPTRILDTRSGLGGSRRLTAGQSITLQVTGTQSVVPPDAVGVAVNITGVQAGAGMYITAYPCGGSVPTTSNLNLVSGETRANAAVVGLSSSGSLCLYASQPVDILIDVTGYLLRSGGDRFTPLAPTRLVDTRDTALTTVNLGTNGAQVPASQALTVPMAGQRGIPADARALTLNVTTVGATGNGFVTAFPAGSALPSSSTVNMQASQAIPNAAVSDLSDAGALAFYASRPTHLIVDIVGYWG